MGQKNPPKFPPNFPVKNQRKFTDELLQERREKHFGMDGMDHRTIGKILRLELDRIQVLETGTLMRGADVITDLEEL